MTRYVRRGEATVPVSGRASSGRAPDTTLGAGARLVTATIGEHTRAITAELASDGALRIDDGEGPARRAVVTRGDDAIWVTIGGDTFALREVEAGAEDAGQHAGDLEAPMPGKVLDVRCAVGDAVTAGQTLLVLEAMKMEHALTAPTDGTVSEVRVAAGDLVSPGAPLVVVDATEEG